MNTQGNGLKTLKKGVLFNAGIFLICSLCFALLPPEGSNSFTGGTVTAGTGGTWDNDSGQAIFDCLVKAKNSNGEAIDPGDFSLSVTVDGQPVEWNTINGFQGTNWKKMVTHDPDLSCAEEGQISLAASGGAVDSLEIRFTNKNGAVICQHKLITLITPTDILTIPAFDWAQNDKWSLNLSNKTEYLVVGFVFSETPAALAMSELHSTKLGTTNPATKTVTFEFPLAAMNGQAVIGARYNLPPAADSQVSCTPIISKVVPESGMPRQSFDGGTGVSVPDITLREVDAGSISAVGGMNKITLTPRNRFEFASVAGAVVQSGNIQIGSPYITDGKIQIDILSPSYGEEGKSTILLSGITVDTLSGLKEGTISVRQTEPNGNSSNFHYAYFNPSE